MQSAHRLVRLAARPGCSGPPTPVEWGRQAWAEYRWAVAAVAAARHPQAARDRWAR